MPVARTVPRLIALAGAAAVLAATASHGVGISLDSVVYARASESLRERGTLEVPLTRWDEDSARIPLSHFPPLVPVTLAGIQNVFDTGPYVAARWLNVACIVATVLLALLPVADSVLAVLVLAAFLAGPSFLTLHVWLWSEPLFLFFLVASVRLAAAALAQPSSLVAIGALGACCGLATLTRYAGFSLAAAYVLLLATSHAAAALRTGRLTAFLTAYVAVVWPWLWYLASSAGAPRAMGFYAEGLWSQAMLPTVREATSWIAPQSLPLAAAVAVAAAVAGAFVVHARSRMAPGDSIGAVARISAFVLVVYLGFLFVARVFFDPGMPFDDRILSVAMVLVALAIADMLKTIYAKSIPVLPATLGAYVALVNLAGSVPYMAHAGRYGLGYASDTWGRSETIATLRHIAPDVTVFSNAPDVIAAKLPVTAKYTPAMDASSRLGELANRIERDAPAVVVLFDDPHAGWLVPRDRLLDALKGLEVRTFADAVVLSRGETGIGR